MYDFADFNDEVPSFRKGEILDIIQCRDDIGWWAAMRTEGCKVGWISKSYVQRLSKEMAEKLRKIPEIVRVHEYNAEQLYNSPVSSGFNRRWKLSCHYVWCVANLPPCQCCSKRIAASLSVFLELWNQLSDIVVFEGLLNGCERDRFTIKKFFCHAHCLYTLLMEVRCITITKNIS